MRPRTMRRGVPGIGAVGVGLLSFVMLWAQPLFAVQVSDEGQGKRLYESQCGSCHGPLGNGGKGANLAHPRLRRATDDQALFNIIRRGSLTCANRPNWFVSYDGVMLVRSLRQ